MGATAVLSLILVSTVGLQTFQDSRSSVIAASQSNTEVTSGTLNAYSIEIPRSCVEQQDGLTWIRPDGRRAIEVFCEDGWALMQKRTGPSVNFHRD